ncbi:arylsulfatase A [Aspergillus heteromorphus CBS 117.55]|uniref:Arylsulfatase A n=1 Tax=Aspergillus heteromorphus CBS 117.55 TaxID=1448321 RepID=A0A317V4U5_9EURO|nr:arylsulfatase A [Aspergillus heteromorphus CBS 117.55]PWY67877.1 arylsulfatase A [Aspergillus heteromorphus CBS 117.55]
MTSQPNFIFIMADDHASKAISCYGAGINSTPNIDRIAHEGMKFNHCYVTNSICTPSRAAILTGTHNHVNGVMTLDSKINKHLPNVAKHLRTGGYQTAMVGKWHLGEGAPHEPTGFDYWTVVPGQGKYHDPEFIEMGQKIVEKGYATDIITDKSLNWLKQRDPKKPFFLMCHHKAPHRSWECHPDHKNLYQDDISLPDTFDDDYKNRAKAVEVAKMRIESDITYFDLGLVQPDGGSEVGELFIPGGSNIDRKIPNVSDAEIHNFRLIDKDTAEIFTFKTGEELRRFKYQRYLKRYLRTIHSVDENVGRLLDYLDDEGLADNTVIIYTSDQGFFLGEHGWFDKRFMYEESFQMPFVIRYPNLIAPNSVCNDIISNVDFATTWLDLAGLRVPSYMQGISFVSLLKGATPPDWKQVAYHRYWMHRDPIHNAYAHYGVRNQRYKLIYWYAEDFELPGTREGGQPREWELFDCEKDPLELFNVYALPEYADVVVDLTALLDEKMLEIGDTPVH